MGAARRAIKCCAAASTACLLLGAMGCADADSSEGGARIAGPPCGPFPNAVFVYLRDDAHSRSIAKLHSELSALDSVERAQVMSKRELHDELVELYADDDLDQELPPASGLPRQIRVEAADPEAAQRVAASVRSSPIVLEVAMGRPATCAPSGAGV